MSDRYTAVVNIRYGLDGRRSELLEQAGSLVECVNAHINSGGEIEQRKSFALQNHAFTASMFGIEATASGLVTFGSVASPGTLPTGVSYRRCQHPTGFKVGGAAATMTGAVSCNYAGKAFVLATFDDGNTYAYYGDVATMPLIGSVGKDGNTLYISTGVEGLSSLATDLAAILSAQAATTVTANVNQNGTAIPGDVLLTTNPGVHVSFSPSVVSASGLLSATLLGQNLAPVVPQTASASFFLASGSGGSIEVFAEDWNPTTGFKSLTNGPIAYTTSLAQTAALVAAAINASRSNPNLGYSAVASLTHIAVYGPTVAGGQGVYAFANAHVIRTVITGGTMVASVFPTQFTGYFYISDGPPSQAISSLPFYTNGAFNFLQATVIAQVRGLTGTPTFVWSAGTVLAGNSNLVTFSASGGTCTFSATAGGSFAGNFQCAVTDSGSGAVLTLTILVTLN